MIALLPKEKLVPLLTSLNRSLEVIAPVLIEGGPCFISWHGEPLALEKNPSTPATEFLLPNRETLFKYIQESGRYTFEESAAKPRFIFGIRPCDLKAISVLDKVFGSKPPDNPYQERRNSTALAVMNCLEPSEQCFCLPMGSGPEAVEGFDLLLTELNDGYLVETGSPAGILFLKENPEFFEDATAEHKSEKQRLLKAAKKAVRSDRTPEGIREAINKADWQFLGQRCMRCGGCTFICPVCHCFNILDLGVPDGERIRCRDSCILSGFTRMAGGDPRKTQSERMKNWYMDKFFYMPENTGLLGCVGCGRCSKVCLTGSDRWTLEAKE